MVRYQVTLAYDGTEFCGFQRQGPSRGRTVQGTFEEALRRLGWEGRAILGAGRTDSGVHASGQGAAFDLEWPHPPEELQNALNALLPPDLSVAAVREVASDFHPRYDALARRYRYRLFCHNVRDPLRERYAWRVWPVVELDRLQAAARFLPGTRDFAAFGTPPRPGGSTVREVTEASWLEAGEDLEFFITANAFLFRMVRRLVYAQVSIGQGRLEAEAILKNLEGEPQPLLQGLAPPQGLALVEVRYP